MKLVVDNNVMNVCEGENIKRSFYCIVGKNGFVSSEDKMEGDGKTPRGEYKLLKAFYREDKLGDVNTNLPKQVIKQKDGWCDDPECDEYNKLITIPFEGSYELMWREDHKYDLVIQISHNLNGVKGRGSAVFVHIKNDTDTYTEGCVAISLEDMLSILPELDENSTIKIL